MPQTETNPALSGAELYIGIQAISGIALLAAYLARSIVSEHGRYEKQYKTIVKRYKIAVGIYILSITASILPKICPYMWMSRNDPTHLISWAVSAGCLAAIVTSRQRLWEATEPLRAEGKRVVEIIMREAKLTWLLILLVPALLLNMGSYLNDPIVLVSRMKSVLIDGCFAACLAACLAAIVLILSKLWKATEGYRKANKKAGKMRAERLGEKELEQKRLGKKERKRIELEKKLENKALEKEELRKKRLGRKTLDKTELLEKILRDRRSKGLITV